MSSFEERAAAAYDTEYSGGGSPAVVFSLRGLALVQKTSSNRNSGTPSFGSQNWPLNPSRPSCLGLDVPNLQILAIGDMPGMSTSFIVPFHNVGPKLVH